MGFGFNITTKGRYEAGSEPRPMGHKGKIHGQDIIVDSGHKKGKILLFKVLSPIPM